MAVKPALQLKLGHRLALTPGLRQSLQFLVMSRGELRDAIEAEAAENPLLQLTRPSDAGGAYEFATETIASIVSLGESLRQQIGAMSLDPKVQRAAFYLIGDLDEDGYLRTDLAEVGTILSETPERLERAVAAIQSCEPTGVGAPNLGECLKLQLQETGVSPQDCDIAIHYLDLIADQNWQKLCKLADITETHAQDLATRIQSLSPHPAQGFAAPADQVSADLIITTHPDQPPLIALSEHNLPRVSVNQELYARAVEDSGAKSFAKEYLARAESLQRAVTFRGNTLLRIAAELVKIQHRFFDGDHENLTPLSKAKLAENLSLHPSTVGRATLGKYLELNGKTLPLGFFFRSPVKQAQSGAYSSYSLQQKIKHLVADEDPESPFSDSAIVAILSSCGVDIARRTVAKYRGCLNIPSSFDRRRQKQARYMRPKS